MGKNKPTFNRRDSFFKEDFNARFDYTQWFERLAELAITVFEWKNLPKEIDARFIELCLFYDGKAVFFKDEELGEYLCMRTMIGGRLNNYNIPKMRKAYAPNGYHRKLNEDNSVIVFNNFLHTNTVPTCLDFAKRLYNIDMTIDTNLFAQKTPVLITCDEKQKFSLQRLYDQYSFNKPVIFGYKNLDPKNISCIKTDAPYMCDRLYELKTSVWNEALTYLGIPNTREEKKERMLVDEVKRNQGGTIASMYSRLEARQQACEQINEMFGLDIWCEYREEFTTGGDDGE